MPEDLRKAIIVPLYKGKGKREDCNNYRGIKLLSVPRKIYGRILNERRMKITAKRVGDEQGFWKGRGCVDQIICSEYFGSYAFGRTEVTTRMDLEKL